MNEQNRGDAPRKFARGLFQRADARLRPLDRKNYWDGDFDLWDWVECTRCLMWRRIDKNLNPKLPKNWECKFFPVYETCHIPRECDAMQDGEFEKPLTPVKPPKRCERTHTVPSFTKEDNDLAELVHLFRPKINKVITDMEVVDNLELKKILTDLAADYGRIEKGFNAYKEKVDEYFFARSKGRTNHTEKKYEESDQSATTIGTYRQTNKDIEYSATGILHTEKKDAHSDKEFDSATRSYLKHMPIGLHPYVKRIIDVLGDGSCGFHVVADALASQDSRPWFIYTPDLIRYEMVRSFEKNVNKFELMMENWQEWSVEKTVGRLKQVEKGENLLNDDERWMAMPEDGFLIADAFECYVYYFSSDGCFTFVPTGIPLPDGERKQICILYVNRHFVRVELMDNCPLPPIPVLLPYWELIRTATSDQWYAPIQDRLDLWTKLIGKSVCSYQSGLVVSFKLRRDEIGTFAVDVNEEEMKNAFSIFGTVKNLEFTLGSESGHVIFEEPKGAEKACAAAVVVFKNNHTASMEALTGHAEKNYWCSRGNHVRVEGCTKESPIMVSENSIT